MSSLLCFLTDSVFACFFLHIRHTHTAREELRKAAERERKRKKREEAARALKYQQFAVSSQLLSASVLCVWCGCNLVRLLTFLFWLFRIFGLVVSIRRNFVLAVMVLFVDWFVFWSFFVCVATL